MNTILTIVTAAHLAALSAIESGDNDRRVGKSGEVSRYQICPAIWNDTMAGQDPKILHGWQDERLARLVVLDVWERRCRRFQAIHNRPPNDLEKYLLWNRPARVLNPRPKEKERAERFANLLKK